MALLTAEDVVQRLSITDTSGVIKNYVNLIVNNAYALMTSRTEIPFPSVSTANEYPFLRSYSNTVRTEYWPVNSISSASYGSTTLTVGTMEEVNNGQKDICIAPNRQGVILRVRPSIDGVGPLKISYNAGYDTLPYELAEVFIQTCALMWKEKDRIGDESKDIGDASIKFTRRLPNFLQTTLDRYTRINYV